MAQLTLPTANTIVAGTIPSNVYDAVSSHTYVSFCVLDLRALAYLPRPSSTLWFRNYYTWGVSLNS